MKMQYCCSELLFVYDFFLIQPFKYQPSPVFLERSTSKEIAAQISTFAESFIVNLERSMSYIYKVSYVILLSTLELRGTNLYASILSPPRAGDLN